jgi:hypothetical protein
VSTIDDASHPIDDGLLLLPVTVKVLSIRLSHCPLLDGWKPGKSENVKATFRVSSLAHQMSHSDRGKSSLSVAGSGWIGFEGSRDRRSDATWCSTQS